MSKRVSEVLYNHIRKVRKAEATAEKALIALREAIASLQVLAYGMECWEKRSEDQADDLAGTAPPPGTLPAKVTLPPKVKIGSGK